MFFTWIFSTVSLVSLLVAKLFFVVSPDTNSLLLALALVASAPWIPLVFSHIRRDMEPLHPLTTRASLGGYLILFGLYLLLAYYFHTAVSTQIFVLVLLFSVYFRVDARVFFALALGGLITTVWSLVFDMTAWAESASIIVYLALVIGVLIELIAPLMSRIHTGHNPLIYISSEFTREYRDTLSAYSILFGSGLGIVMVVLIVLRGLVWNYAFSMLLFFAMGYMLLALIAVTTERRTLHITGYIRDEYRLLTYILKRSKYAYIWLCALLMILVDIAYFRALPWTTQSLIVVIGTALLSLGVYMYPRISRIVRNALNSSSL